MAKTAAWLQKPIKGVLCDITGVLYNSGPGGGIVIEGSLDAISRLKEAGIPVRFVTNETQCTRQKLVDKLGLHGYNLSITEVFPPAPAVCTVLKERNLRPFLLVHPGVLPEFSEFSITSPNCVVVGDAEEEFSFANVNRAFQILSSLANPILLAMGRGKYYKQGDNLQIDLGAYVAALEYSTDVKAEILGKPSPNFFSTALQHMGVKAEEAVMIGDDILHDVGGAQSCGARGILVRTGKFRPSDETHPTVKPDAIVDNLASAVDAIITQRSAS